MRHGMHISDLIGAQTDMHLFPLRLLLSCTAPMIGPQAAAEACYFHACLLGLSFNLLDKQHGMI